LEAVKNLKGSYIYGSFGLSNLIFGDKNNWWDVSIVDKSIDESVKIWIRYVPTLHGIVGVFFR